MTLQRTAAAAAAASALARAGPRRSTNIGPSTKNTMTSAATDSDPQQARGRRRDAGSVPPDHGERIVHGMTAEHTAVANRSTWKPAPSPDMLTCCTWVLR